jgi:hypothetical protein
VRARGGACACGGEGPRMVGIELKIQEAGTFVHANHSQTVNEPAGAAAAAACHRILSDDLNVSCVTQYSVVRVLTHEHLWCLNQ